MNVQQADGSVLPQLGPSVEPVQLQVVGLRLWERLPPGAAAITAADVEALGDVGATLGDYYAERVSAVAAATGVAERAVRAWFGRELITPQGVRGQVLQGSGESAGLPNQAIARLVDAYLVRAEPRRGATWYELAHDRLIEPVRAGNAAWFAANLSTLQRQAELWEERGRPEGLLLRGAALAEAEGWAAANADALTPVERDFLDLCRAARRRSALLRGLSAGVALAALAALALALVANSFRLRADASAQTAEANRLIADANAREARAGELAAAAAASLVDDPQGSLIMARAAYAVAADAGEKPPAVAVEALGQAVAASRLRRLIITGERGLQDVAVSPDGQTLASAGNDGVLRLFDAARGPELRSIETNSRDLQSLGLAFSPDGARLAAIAADRALIWGLAGDGEPITLDGHPDESSDVAANDMLGLAFSPDGRRLATASADGTARIWDAASGQELQRLDAGGPELWAVAFSPDGATLAAGDGDGQIVLWRAEGGAELRRIPAHKEAITSLAFSPDGATLASGSLDLTARLWDVERGEQRDVLRGHTTGVERVVFSPDGQTLATASQDGTARLWAVADGRQILTLAGHQNGVTGVRFSPDGNTLVTASLDGTIRIWSLGLAPADGAYAAAFSPDGQTLATIGAGDLRLWDGAGETLLRSIPLPYEATAIAYSPDGARIALGTLDGPILLVDPAGGVTATLEGHLRQVNRLAFSPDGRTLASASDDFTLRLWDLAEGRELPSFPPASDVLTVVAFSPDGRLLASADSGYITVRDLTADSLPQSFELKGGEIVQGLAFSPDGAHLAAADEGGELAFWELATGQELARVTLDGAILDLAYSPDGAALATAEDRRRVRLWDANTLAPLRALPHPAQVYTVAFSPDGRRLLTAAIDGVARLFPLPTEDLLALAEARTLRGPTPAECAAYGPLTGCPAP